MTFAQNDLRVASERPLNETLRLHGQLIQEYAVMAAIGFLPLGFYSSLHFAHVAAIRFTIADVAFLLITGIIGFRSDWLAKSSGRPHSPLLLPGRAAKPIEDRSLTQRTVKTVSPYDHPQITELFERDLATAFSKVEILLIGRMGTVRGRIVSHEYTDAIIEDLFAREICANLIFDRYTEAKNPARLPRGLFLDRVERTIWFWDNETDMTFAEGWWHVTEELEHIRTGHQHIPDVIDVEFDLVTPVEISDGLR